MEPKTNEIADREKTYDTLTAALVQMARETESPLSLLANAAALLNMHLEHINWVGFYLLHDDVLFLGPFQGKPAVSRIETGRGVCGTAVKESRIQRVDDVHVCTNHIVCDAASASEIVVPMLLCGKPVGVLDIDSPTSGRFNAEDEAGLAAFVEMLTRELAARGYFPR